MNARSQYTRAQHLRHLADTTRAIGARMLSALVLLPLLAACATTPGAAQQNVVKAVVREKPIASMPTPIPTTVPTAKPLKVLLEQRSLRPAQPSLSALGWWRSLA